MVEAQTIQMQAMEQMEVLVVVALLVVAVVLTEREVQATLRQHHLLVAMALLLHQVKEATEEQEKLIFLDLLTA